MNVLQSNPESLHNRLIAATVGSCTCLTKSPDVRVHDPQCHYRLFSECTEALTTQNDQCHDKGAPIGLVDEARSASADELLQPCPCCQGKGVEKISMENEIFSHRLRVWGLSIGIICMLYWIFFGHTDEENIKQAWWILIIVLGFLIHSQTRFRNKLNKWRRYKRMNVLDIKT